MRPVAGSRFFPSDDVTVAEWRYLVRRYPDDEAVERRDRIRQMLKRLVRKVRTRAGASPSPLTYYLWKKKYAQLGVSELRRESPKIPLRACGVLVAVHGVILEKLEKP